MYGIIIHLSTRYGEDPSWEHTLSKPHESSISKPTITASYTEKLITVTKSQSWKMEAENMLYELYPFKIWEESH